MEGGGRLDVEERLRGLFSVFQHDGLPYCHIPCYGYLFGPKGGQPDPRHWAYENVWTAFLVVRQLGLSCLSSVLNPAPFPPKALVTWLSPLGVNIGDVGCYIYDPVDIRSK